MSAVVHLPLSWAESLIANATGPVPEYGSRAWTELPDDDRRKVAACVRAAENWRTRGYGAELIAFPSRRAREIAEARRPRPSDHPGGPVLWDRDKAAAGD